MEYSTARVSVRDPAINLIKVCTDINDLSEIKDLVNMRRSYVKDTITNRDVRIYDYGYFINLVRDDCTFRAEYNVYDELTVMATAKLFSNDSLYAKLSYKKPTGVLRLRELKVKVEAKSEADDVMEKFQRAFAMFLHVREIAPVIVGDKVKPKYVVICDSLYRDSGLKRKEGGAKRQAFKAGILKQLTDFNVLAKL
jgi:hypothetical protein